MTLVAMQIALAIALNLDEEKQDPSGCKLSMSPK